MAGRMKNRTKVLIFLLSLVLFLVGYSWVFRNYLDGDQYLQMAYDYTGQDQSIIDWQNPEFEIVQHMGVMTIHFTFHTTEDDTRGPISLYIDPLKKAVIDVEPRSGPNPDS